MFEFTENYKTYIKSPRWKATCQRYWRTFGKKCQACGSRNNLHVHHKSYERFGREPLADLCGVCEPCHRIIHQIHRSDKKKSLRLVTERYVVAKRMNRTSSR